MSHTLMPRPSSGGLRDARKGIGVQYIFVIFTTNADALAGIAKPARALASFSASIPMNAEAMSGFVPKGLQGLLAASF